MAREKLMLTITHDIKAPVGSILGYIDLLTRLLKEERQRFYLQNMKSSARHLLDLVSSLLDYHKLESHKMEVNQIPFNPYELFQTIYTSFEPLANKKNLQLRFEGDERLNRFTWETPSASGRWPTTCCQTPSSLPGKAASPSTLSCGMPASTFR